MLGLRDTRDIIYDMASVLSLPILAYLLVLLWSGEPFMPNFLEGDP